MDTETADRTVNELLAHMSWTRRLAQRLHGDAAHADDLAQDTFLAGMEHPPAIDRPLQPWLRTVLRNLRSSAGIAQRRRMVREAVFSADEADRQVPSTEETMGRLEAHRQLVDLVAQLEEPLRNTLLLRYFDGWSSAEIARAQGVPAGTVRWRLKAAIDELRRRMDALHPGSREDWLRALLHIPALPVEPDAAPEPGTVSWTTAALVATVAIVAGFMIGLGTVQSASGEAPSSKAVPVAAPPDAEPPPALFQEERPPAPVSQELLKDAPPTRVPRERPSRRISKSAPRIADDPLAPF